MVQIPCITGFLDTNNEKMTVALYQCYGQSLVETEGFEPLTLRMRTVRSPELCAERALMFAIPTEPYFYQLPHISKSAGPVVILSYVGIISSYTLLFFLVRSDTCLISKPG